ncbi:trimeric intracellular cation channel family protein [Corynebacterium flavescens]|uniref:trimeric intracellular cation channel family protein n=1 Tax=Corynebacterium flavescens TaxID=28028 RepID=UPI003FD4C689
MEVDPFVDSLYRWSDVSGVLLMGIIGGTIARQRGYDIVGYFFIALISALGGGIIRDVLISRGTVAAMSQPEYLILAFAGALIARFVFFKGRTWELLQAHGDAVVSALWAGTGTVKALSFGLPLLPCIMMGVFTATGGSMIRDIVTGRVPTVFGDNQPTVVPAVACAVIVVGCNRFDLLVWGMVAGPIISLLLFLAGYWGGWRLHTDQDWAPVNDTAVQVAAFAKKAEDRGRSVGRRIEPTKIRSWRHRQMEKALQRRIEKEVRRGRQRSQAESDADKFYQEFTNQFGAIGEQDKSARDSQQEAEAASPSSSFASAEASKGGEDKSTSNHRIERQTDVENEDGLFSGMGMDLSGDSYEGYDERKYAEHEAAELAREHRRMLDVILADDTLTDELIDKLVHKYRESAQVGQAKRGREKDQAKDARESRDSDRSGE